MITVFTPTYNRKHTLTRLYNSLCLQTNKNFEWLIVDDGSTDDTESLIFGFHPKDFVIRYYKQNNGGKHRAINYGVSLSKGTWFFIVDSDDYLRNDAIDIISRNLLKIECDDNFCALVVNRVNTEGEVVGSICNYKQLDADFCSYRTILKIKGDKAEIVRTSVMREFPFPEIEGELFCPENIVWYRMSQKYIARYINEDVYFCEYLEGGLTDGKEFIKVNNPIGYIIYYFEYFHCVRSIKYKIFASVNYWIMYRYILCKNASFKCNPDVKLKIMYPFYLLYMLFYLIKNKLCF